MENKIISRITTKNYRNLVNEEGIELNNLNILIGSNGSGKSNLVALLEFFKNCLTPSFDLESRGITAFQDAIAKLRNNILDAAIQKPAVVKVKFEFPNFNRDYKLIFELSLHVSQDYSPYIAEENFFGRPKNNKCNLYLFLYHSHTPIIGNGFININHDGSDEIKVKNLKKIENIPTNELGLIAIPKLLTERGDFYSEQVPLYKIQRELTEGIKKWQFYNANQMDLTKIRGASPKVGMGDIILSKSCENLPTVLDNLINHSKYGLDFEERINNAMKEILPSTRRLKTSRDSGGITLTIQWYFDGMETPFYLDDMSDGTVRMLCWAIVLHSPILPTLLVIDEPELSLHIGWMGILANWVKQASQKTQIIISTHSPDLLDELTDCANDVICFDKAQQKGHFQAKRLPEAILQEKIAEGWRLGDLYRVGDDIVGGWPW